MYDFSELTDLTLGELCQKTNNCSNGFSIEKNCFRYLGREIQLKDGKSYFSSEGDNKAVRAKTLESLPGLQSRLIVQLPDSTIAAFLSVASWLDTVDFSCISKSGQQHEATANLTTELKEFTTLDKWCHSECHIPMSYLRHRDNFQMSIPMEVRVAAQLLIVHDPTKAPPQIFNLYDYSVDGGSILQDLHDNVAQDIQHFTSTEKYQILSALQKKTGWSLSNLYQNKKFGLSVPDIFKLINEAIKLKRFSTLTTFKITRCNVFLDMMDSDDNDYENGLEWLNDLILLYENKKMAEVLKSELHCLKKQIDTRRQTDQTLCESDERYLKTWLNNLFYLFAACCDHSEDADVTELASYLRSISRIGHTRILYYARELAFLAQQPGSIDYSQYVDVIACILTDKSFTIEENFQNNCNQLTDIRGFTLLESDKALTPYLEALRAVVEIKTPTFKDILLPEIEKIRNRFTHLQQAGCSFTNKDRQDVRERVHSLLLVIAACKNKKPENTISASELNPFVQGMMVDANKNRKPYLAFGLACLVQISPQMQRLLLPPFGKKPTGGNNSWLVLLSLLRLYQAAKISMADMAKVWQNLQTGTKGRKIMKKGEVFQHWLVTLDKIQASSVMHKILVGRSLINITDDMINISASLTNLVSYFTGLEKNNKGNSDEALENFQTMGIETLQRLGLLEGILAENQPVREWLSKQRKNHFLLFYLNEIRTTKQLQIPEKTELIELINRFLKVSVSKNKFVKDRQSPVNNPHLQAVYRQRPGFVNGWKANFAGFSPDICRRLKDKETLELTEDPWDLFISGDEVASCLSPLEGVSSTCGLMSYVMDGRNAMIVKKNPKGRIINRAVIRIVFVEGANLALFIEQAYRRNKHEKYRDEVSALLTDAACEIADQMGLPLYRASTSEENQWQEKKLKLLAGRAPFDYFDSTDGIGATRRIAETIIDGSEVTYKASMENDKRIRIE